MQVYAEFSIGYARVEEIDPVLADAGLRSQRPDFFIGAHAAVAQFPLLTRDPRRYTFQQSP
jgi:predicted nucleic acid-binding protein